MNYSTYHIKKVNQKIEIDLKAILKTTFLNESINYSNIGLNNNNPVYKLAADNLDLVHNNYFVWKGDQHPLDFYKQILLNKDEIIKLAFKDINADLENIYSDVNIVFIELCYLFDVAQKNDFFERLFYLGKSHSFIEELE